MTILKYMTHFMLETFSVPDMYVSVQAVLSVCFETHNGIRDGIVRLCVAHHVRSLLLLARGSLYVRDGTQIKRGVSTLKYSIAHDFVMTWDDLENIGHHTFSCDFWVVPEEHPIVFTGAPVNPKTNQKVHDAVLVRDVQRARHVRGDPGWFVSVCYETLNGQRDGFVRRCVAHSFPSAKRREAVSLRVETYGTEMGSLRPGSRSTKR